jgi:hypothetical protein
MKNEAFSNQIFAHYREQQKKIKKAIQLLKEHNYTVIEPKTKYK